MWIGSADESEVSSTTIAFAALVIALIAHGREAHPARLGSRGMEEDMWGSAQEISYFFHENNVREHAHQRHWTILRQLLLDRDEKQTLHSPNVRMEINVGSFL